MSPTVCPQVAVLNGEIERTLRRADLQTENARLTDAIPVSAVVGAADPASSALSGYLGVMGVAVSASAIAQWLVLVPVIALELGAKLFNAATNSQA